MVLILRVVTPMKTDKQIESICKEHVPNVIHELLVSRPAFSRTPVNRCQQRRRLWRDAGKCPDKHAQLACYAVQRRRGAKVVNS